MLASAISAYPSVPLTNAFGISISLLYSEDKTLKSSAFTVYRFASMASQMLADKFVPSNLPHSWMPVGEVTLISVI